MARPDFLIVGAMKAGTTTLHQDLRSHPGIFLPVLKEPETLARLDDMGDIGREYDVLFRPARKGQIRGEASTVYTKRPDHEGIAAKALALCGPDLKIIYLRRDPVERTISHYLHEHQHGIMVEPFDEAVRKYRRLIDYSRYDWQIAPWIAAFGDANVLQMELETYSRERSDTVARVLRFLGLDPEGVTIDPETAYNRRDEQKHISNPLLRAFAYSRFYQLGLKPLIPRAIRRKGRQAILPAAEVTIVEPDAETLRYIRTRLREDAEPAARHRPRPPARVPAR